MKKLNVNLKVFERFKYALIIAGVVLLTGIIFLVIPALGMNVGLDFAGGAKMSVAFGDLSQDARAAKETAVIKVIEDEGFTYDGNVRWSQSDEQGQVLEVGIKYELDGKKINYKDDEAQLEFATKIGATEGDANSLDIVMGRELGLDYKTDVSCHIVSGSTSNIVLKNAIIALLVAVAVILVYIVIRFTVSSGIAAVIALTHDVLIMIALTTIFRVQVNTTFIAAVITIVGYSINATIVIFDRVRELRKQSQFEAEPDEFIVNKAVNDTFSRSVLTTVTTLIVIVVLAIVCQIMGVATMAEFALPIIFGLCAGFFSSVFISAPLWVYLRRLGRKILSKKAKK